MPVKKKIKLKKKFKKAFLLIISLIVLIFGGIKINRYVKYSKTIDYALEKKGYDKNTTDLIKNKLSKENQNQLLSSDKIDYIKEIIRQKYYIDKKFNDYLKYYEDNSKKSFEDIVTLVNIGATKNWYEDTKITDISKGTEILVNKYYTLPEDYNPGVIKKFSSTYAYGEVSAEESCYNAFIQMAKSAKEDDITLILTSGYRSYEKQNKIYEDMKKSKGSDYADKFAARPGSSEHETGLSLDILTYNGRTETFKETKTYAWLHEHAQDYGFIERYEESKEYITGYEAESWHYRYVGIELAKKIKEEGITFDEYYAFYIENE